MDLALTALLAAQLLALPPTVPSPIEIGRAQEPSFIYSDAYFKRLAIHRAASYAILPLFALQYAAGSQLYEHGPDAPEWAKVGHRVGATGVLALFVTQVATGVPNLIEGRKDPNGRGRRFFHATMMLTASAGFVATGILSERAESSEDDRELHRAVALTSVTIATIGYLSMLEIFRP